MNLAGIATPAGLVDIDIVARNCARMAQRARELNVRLRPHVKTHKTVEGARLQVGAKSGPVTVSTLAEARHLTRAGFRDFTWAVPLAPAKLAAAGELVESGVQLGLLVDHPAAVTEAEVFAQARGICCPVWLEVDCGGARSGIDPSSPEAIGLAARIAASTHLELRGLLTHAGHAYAAAGFQALRRVSHEERDAVVRLAGRLEREGLRVPEVSVGSTPTMVAADDLSGVTEIRPGNYVFFDAFQVAVGSATLADVAFTVAASVIGLHPERGTVVLDAGALALSQDAGPVHVDPGCGFGIVLDPETDAPLEAARLVMLSQEHGVVRVPSGFDWRRLHLGAVVRVVPNHSCLAAALFDHYHLVHGGEVIGTWRPTRGW